MLVPVLSAGGRSWLVPHKVEVLEGGEVRVTGHYTDDPRRTPETVSLRGLPQSTIQQLQRSVAA